MKTLTFAPGEVIFWQGDFSNSMFDIISGKVGIYSGYETEQEKLLAKLGKDDTLGEMGMIEVYPRSATAVALEPETVLVEIGEDELNEYFKNKPDKLLCIMKQLSKRIRETNGKYYDACRAIYESDEAERSGIDKSEELKMLQQAMCLEIEHYGYFY